MYDPDASERESLDGRGVTLPERTRTITWADPEASARASQRMNGLEFLRALQAGTLPRAPIFETMGFWPVEFGEGYAVFAAKPEEYHYNPIGSVHGGVAATLLDSAMGCAVNTTLPAGVGYTTLELKINYVRPMTSQTGIVRCEGHVIHTGKRVATAEARLTDAGGKLLAHGTTTCMIFRE